MKNALGTNRSDTIRKMREVKRKERGERERERGRCKAKQHGGASEFSACLFWIEGRPSCRQTDDTTVCETSQP